MNNFGYIYTFWDKKLKRYVYVGQTGDFNRRMKDHSWESKQKNPAYFEDKNQRFWSFNEYATIYEEMNQQQDQKKIQTPQEKQISVKREQIRKQAIAAIITKNKKNGKQINQNLLNNLSDDELVALVQAD